MSSMRLKDARDFLVKYNQNIGRYITGMRHAVDRLFQVKQAHPGPPHLGATES